MRWDTRWMGCERGCKHRPLQRRVFLKPAPLSLNSKRVCIAKFERTRCRLAGVRAKLRSQCKGLFAHLPAPDGEP